MAARKKGGRKKPRTPKQKAATRKMQAAARRARAAGRRTSKRGARRAKRKVTVMGKVGASRKRGKVIGVLDRRPGYLYYVTKNGSIVETSCVRGGCRKSKPGVRVTKGRITQRNERVALRRRAA